MLDINIYAGQVVDLHVAASQACFRQGAVSSDMVAHFLPIKTLTTAIYVEWGNCKQRPQLVCSQMPSRNSSPLSLPSSWNLAWLGRFFARIFSVSRSLRGMVTVDAVLNLFSIEFVEELHLRRTCALPKPNQLAKLARGAWKASCIIVAPFGAPSWLLWCQDRWAALIFGEFKSQL